MVEINPLQLASQFQPKPADTSVIDKLRASSALAGINNRSLERRTGVQQSGALDRTLAGLGLSQGTMATGLPALNRDLRFERIAPAAATAQRGGLHFQLPTDKPITIGQLPDVAIGQGDMAGASAAKAAVEAQAELEETEEKEQHYVGDVPIGTSKRKSKKSRKDKVKQKGTPRAKAISDEILDAGRASRFMQSTQQQNPDAVVENPRIENGVLTIDINGVPKQYSAIKR